MDLSGAGVSAARAPALGRPGQQQAPALLLAFAIQYLGLLFERWFFFAQANHPQNLYYQVVG